MVLGLSAGDQQAALRCVAVPVVCRSHPGRASVCRPADNTADLASLVPGCFLSANVQFSTNFYNHGDPTFDVRSEEMKKVTVCTHTSLLWAPPGAPVALPAWPHASQGGRARSKNGQICSRADVRFLLASCSACTRTSSRGCPAPTTTKV